MDMHSSDPFQMALFERKKSKQQQELTDESPIMEREDPELFNLMSGNNNEQVQQKVSDPFALALQERKIKSSEKDQFEDEDLWGTAKRFGARTISSLASNVAGLPSLAENLTKAVFPSVGLDKEGLIKERDKVFPTPTELKEFNKNLFGKELLEPRNDWEKKLDEVTDDFILGAIPVFGGPARFARPLLASIAGNAVKSGSDALGFSEETGSKAKTGAMIASYLVNPGAAKVLENRLYNQQERALPRNAVIDAPHLENHINQFETILLRGGTAPSKTEALRKIREIRRTIQNGQIPVRELTSFKKSINELIADRYSAIGVSDLGSQATLHNLNRIGTAVDRTISRYGRRDPTWHNIYRQANEVHRSVNKGEQIRRWLDKNRKSFVKNASLAHALGHGISAPVLATAIGAELSIRASTLFSKMARSPTLTRHYLQFLNEAARRNVGTVNKELEKIDKLLK